MAGSATVRVSIVITTRNRVSELRHALMSAINQEGEVEVIVVDDGSSDGTDRVIPQEFPGVRYFRSAVSRGYIAQRNFAARVARGDVLISIDDDAVFTGTRTAIEAVAQFSRPEIGVVALPFINVKDGMSVRQCAPEPEGVYITESFTGTAYAVRRDIFLALGGFRELWVHQGEEMDFAIRMLEVGHVVRLGHGDPIHHFQSVNRQWSRMDFYGRRNDVLFAWQNVPFPDIVAHLPATLVNGIVCAIRVGRYRSMVLGTMAGLSDIGRGTIKREPVRSTTYRLSRALRRRGTIPLDGLDGHGCGRGN